MKTVSKDLQQVADNLDANPTTVGLWISGFGIWAAAVISRSFYTFYI